MCWKVRSEVRQVALFQGARIVGHESVQADNRVTLGEQFFA